MCTSYCFLNLISHDLFILYKLSTRFLSEKRLFLKRFNSAPVKDASSGEHIILYPSNCFFLQIVNKVSEISNKIFIQRERTFL